MPSGVWKTVQLILEDLCQNGTVEKGIEIYFQSHGMETMSTNDIQNFRIQSLSIYLWALVNSPLIVKTGGDQKYPKPIYVGFENAAKHNDNIIKTTGCNRVKDPPANEQDMHPCESGVLTMMDMIQTALPPIYQHTSFVKARYRNKETCLRTRIRVAKFIRTMYIEHMMLHNSNEVNYFQNMENGIGESALHESRPANYRFITHLVAQIDSNTSPTSIHNYLRLEKIPEDLHLDIHKIDELMSTTELQSHKWFENAIELKKLSKLFGECKQPNDSLASHQDLNQLT